MTPDYEGLNLIELLDQLEPTPEPAPIPMTPQTPGWIVLGAVLALAALWAIRKLVLHRRARAYRRAALRELDRAGDDAARIADVLRRAALAGFPRAQVAGLHGQGWLAFLDRTGPGGFDSAAGNGMLTAPYRESRDDPALARLARDWVRKHRQGAG
ncbi:MAG: DUF4381 domain-containing protein [Jhaorihella sp.]